MGTAAFSSKTSSGILLKDEDEDKQFLALSDCTLTVQRVLDEIKASDQAKVMIEHSHVFATYVTLTIMLSSFQICGRRSTPSSSLQSWHTL